MMSLNQAYNQLIEFYIKLRMRLDKYLSALEILSRKQSRRIIPRGWFFVNWIEVKKCDYDIKQWDTIEYDGVIHEVKRDITVRIYKPSWYLSSDKDGNHYPSYKQLLTDCPYASLLHIAWRLDLDTEGLLIATSDWQLAHRIISPKHHLPKVYIVTTKDPLTKNHCRYLSKWVILDDWYKTLPAKCELLWENQCQLTLKEWKFHQVKRMIIAIWNEVTHLKRISVWDRTLDGLDVGKREIIEE